jgi:tRNA(Ile)-lysidine synthase
LLGLSRAEVRTLAQRLELPFVDDPTNEDPSQPRVAIRTEVLPVLARLRAGAELAIAASADAAREALDAIDVAVQAELARRLDAGTRRVQLDGIAAIPRAVRTRLVRQVCLAGGLPADAVGRRPIADIDRALLELGPRRSWALRGRHRVVVDGRQLWVESSPEDEAPP